MRPAHIRLVDQMPIVKCRLGHRTTRLIVIGQKRLWAEYRMNQDWVAGGTDVLTIRKVIELA